MDQRVSYDSLRGRSACEERPIKFPDGASFELSPDVLENRLLFCRQHDAGGITIEAVDDTRLPATPSYAEQLGPDIAELSFCAGVSQMQANDSAESMLSRADEAQYLAKATGKGHTRTQEELSPAAAD